MRGGYMSFVSPLPNGYAEQEALLEMKHEVGECEVILSMCPSLPFFYVTSKHPCPILTGKLFHELR